MLLTTSTVRPAASASFFDQRFLLCVRIKLSSAPPTTSTTPDAIQTESWIVTSANRATQKDLNSATVYSPRLHAGFNCHKGFVMTDRSVLNSSKSGVGT